MIKTHYNANNTKRMRFWDSGSHETLDWLFPFKFYDDFAGYKLNKYITAENTSAPWAVVETDLNLGINLVDDSVLGVCQITLDSDDITEQGALYFGDNLNLDLSKGLIFETRLTFPVLPTSGGGEDSRAVFGLASATGADLDAIATNAWFRVESAANTALLWETDDGDTDDDDNAAGITLVANTYNVYRIDFTDTSNVRFYVDGALVGTASMAGLTGAEVKVQPYFCMSKTKSAANTAVGTMYIDYVKVFQNRN